MRARFLSVFLALAAFVLNPAFGCGDDFEYGADEMRAAAEGVWELRMPGEPKPLVRFELRYASPVALAKGAGLVQQAAACTDRVFVAPASACTDTSSMSFSAKVLESREPLTDKIRSAELWVHGRRFTWGSLTIGFESGASLRLLTTPTPGEIGGDLTIPAPGSEPSSKKITAVRLSSLP